MVLARSHLHPSLLELLAVDHGGVPHANRVREAVARVEELRRREHRAALCAPVPRAHVPQFDEAPQAHPLLCRQLAYLAIAPGNQPTQPMHLPAEARLLDRNDHVAPVAGEHRPVGPCLGALLALDHAR